MTGDVNILGKLDDAINRELASTHLNLDYIAALDAQVAYEVERIKAIVAHGKVTR